MEAPEDLHGRTRLLILQGTPFCNLDCAYCYLPNRDDRRRMPLEIVAAAVDWIYRHGLAADPLSIVWHAGEPLVLPVTWYEAAFGAVRAAAPARARVRHHMQTNATLIDPTWCDFFLEHQVTVGVSLDGPARLHDLSRKTRRGGGSHAQVMRGVAALQRRGVPFHVICVVGRETLDAPDELADFFIREGLPQVGFNIEEVEGINVRSSLSAADVAERYGRFLDRFLERAERHGGLHVREADAFVNKISHPHFGKVRRNDENLPFALVTVAHDGQISTYSPELADLDHPHHGSFRFGHVSEVRPDDIVRDARFRAIENEVAAGVAACAADCPHFAFCGGGAPSNKLAETGSLAATETLFCRLTQKTTVDVMLRRLTARLQQAEAPPPQPVADL
jgi:uncharacterized protein